VSELASFVVGAAASWTLFVIIVGDAVRSMAPARRKSKFTPLTEAEIKEIVEDTMGKHSEIAAEQENDPMPERGPEAPAEREFTLFQARLFVKMINDYESFVDATILDMFHIGVIQYALNLVNKVARDRIDTSDYNRIHSPAKNWAVVRYVEYYHTRTKP
jgi:hypothetical protein